MSTGVAELTGRELDAAVHRQVMGVDCRWDTTLPPEFVMEGSEELFRDYVELDTQQQPRMGISVPGGPIRIRVPAYSSDIAAAMLVADKMIADGWLPAMDYMLDGWRVAFRKPWSRESPREGYYHHSPSLPESICVAALAAVEAKQ